jgi:hypothetical protein
LINNVMSANKTANKNNRQSTSPHHSPRNDYGFY